MTPFTNHNHPEIGIAAAEVLDRAGAGVRLVPEWMLAGAR